MESVFGVEAKLEGKGELLRILFLNLDRYTSFTLVYPMHWNSRKGKMSHQYCESIYKSKRRATREVMVGNVGIGGRNPIRIQSMTTSNTRDVAATVEQVIKLSDVGCEIVRVTVQGKKEASACEEIKNRLLQKGYTIPIVADIHFYPPAAMLVVESVDKVRINPGNYLDKRASFRVLEYSDAEYAAELLRLEENFAPLVDKCKRLKKAMRIGTNHGSLSDRIMNRYGNTAHGMVEAALEYARVCRKYDYHDLVFSMKASHTQVMIQAYRLLAQQMMQLGWDYPLHLGVTEAGEGEDGRVKSAIGIGSLLLDGLGDTVRVSLTEDPWLEIDPCKRLVALAESYDGQGVAPFKEELRNINGFKRRDVVLPVHFHRDGAVALAVEPTVSPELLGALPLLNSYQREIDTVDLVKVDEPLSQDNRALLRKLAIGLITPECCHPLKEVVLHAHTSSCALSKQIHAGSLESYISVTDESVEQWEALKVLQPGALLLAPHCEGRLHYARHFFEWLQQQQLALPVILNFQYRGDWDDVVIAASAECGALLCDGLGDGLLIEGLYPAEALRLLSFSILQGARCRTVKTEFISCPSCGRTLFNLQEVSRKIRERTGHLPGVKIAIMGCIVNGPGEMADADFGYVGSRPGMIDLYVGKECIQKNIPDTEAVEKLVDLIKAHGLWVDAEV